MDPRRLLLPIPWLRQAPILALFLRLPPLSSPLHVVVGWHCQAALPVYISAGIEPRQRLLDLKVPFAHADDDPLQGADQVQCDALADPQARQAPSAVEGEPYAPGERAAVVADDVNDGADPLPAHSPQCAAAGAVEAVGDLEERHVRHDVGHELDDAHVVVEQLSKNVLDGQQDRHNRGADDDAQHGGAVRGSFRIAGPSRAKQIPEPARRGDAETEWDRVDDLVGRHDDRLRRQWYSAQPAGGQRYNLKRPPLRADVHDP